MVSIEVRVDEALFRKARQYADEHNTTLETLLTEHLTELADRSGRRLTVREQVYADCTPSEEVKAALREDFCERKAKGALVVCQASNAVIPVLVTGIHLAACSGARGWLDAGDKPRHDNGALDEAGGLSQRESPQGH